MAAINPESHMRKLFLILALAAGAAIAQTQPPAAPAPAVQTPMVPTIKPPLGASSRASRHESFAREREQRIEEKTEDRAEADKKRKTSERALRQTDR